MFRHVSAIAIALLTVLALGSCSGASSTNRQTTPPQQDSWASQVTGSPEATASPSPTDASSSSGSTLSAKLLTGPVAGVELQEIDRIMLPHDIESIFGYCGDCEVDPPECLTTGLGSPEVASQAKDNVTTATVMLSSDTSSPGKHREYAQSCPSASGTAGSAPFTMNVELLPEPDVEGASDVVATKDVRDLSWLTTRSKSGWGSMASRGSIAERFRRRRN